MNNQRLFHKVVSPDRKDKLLHEFVLSLGILNTKLLSGELLVLKPYLIKDQSIFCKIDSGDFSKKTPTKAQGVHNFLIRGEQYFFKSQMLIKEKTAEISLPAEIFHLQRRQSYRIQIPEFYKGIVLLKKVESHLIQLKAKLINLSLGGCAFEISDAAGIHMENELLIEVSTKKHVLFESTSVVRQVKRNKENETLLIGVEFIPINPSRDQIIFSVTLDIHRSLHGKFF